VLWEKFKSGTDIRGITDDSANGEQQAILTNDAIEKIIHSFVVWLGRETGLEYASMAVAVGHDSRLSAFRIKNVIVNALRIMSIKVYDCGMTSTPAMAGAASILSCTAAIQITASHHGRDKNGMKFFTPAGGLSGKDIDVVLEMCRRDIRPEISSKKSDVKTTNIMAFYSNGLKKFICKELGTDEKKKPLAGLKIVVDAGNGVGGFFAEDVLKKLGCDISGSVFLEPDGNFPNHEANPANEEAMTSILRATIDAKADLGIIFDTDVDRAAFVDNHGEAIDGNRLIALISATVLKKHPQSTIVTDSVTSDKLKEFIKLREGKHFRFKRGYQNVITAAKKLNQGGIECHLAIETSGHAAFKENNFIDDGAYLACIIILEMIALKKSGKTFANLLSGFVGSKEKKEIRIKIRGDDTLSCSKKVLNAFKRYFKEIKSCELDEDNLEGVRLKFNSRWQEGWCLLRSSIHDPVLVLNVESYVKGGGDSILKSLRPFFEKFESLDFS
jgi:phosphomannomutase